MKDTLAIIAPTYSYVLDDFLKSLRRQKNKNFHLFISDVADEKKEIKLKGINVSVLKLPNKGYAFAVNAGIDEAIKEGFDKFLVINDDTSFKEDFVDNVLSSLNNHPQTLIAGKIYYESGYEYHKERYKKSDLGNVLWYAGGYFDWDHGTSHHRGVDEIDEGQYDTKGPTEFVTGCLMAYDRQVYEQVGDWDEKFFLYYEDADVCVRAKNAGVPIVYDPSLKIWHKVSQSTGGSGSAFHMKYQNKNKLRFGLRYAPLKTKLHLVKNYLLFGK